MNYQKLARSIIWITSCALLACIAAFFAVLLKFGDSTMDFQGASGVASILPAFAGVLIAAIALYSYVKREDQVHGEAVGIYLARKKVLSTAELMILMDQHFINEGNRHKDHMEFYMIALRHVLVDGLDALSKVIAEIQIYMEQVSAEKDKEAFVERVGELRVIAVQVSNQDVDPVILIKMCYMAHESVHRLVKLIVADMEQHVGPDQIYNVLTTKKPRDYLQSQGQKHAERHMDVMRQFRHQEATTATAQ